MEEKNNQVDNKSEFNDFVGEEKKKEGKNYEKIAMVICIIAVLAAIVGVSFATWTWTKTGAQNTLSTGSISLEFLESTGEVINMSNFLPMSDTNGKALTGTGKKFDFAVISTSNSSASTTMTYSITVTKPSADSGYTLLKNDQVKFYLTKFTGTNETQVVAPTLFSTPMGTSGTSGSLVTGLTHAHSSSAKTVKTNYRLRMWVAGTTDASSWTSTSKLQYKVKLGVSGSMA